MDEHLFIFSFVGDVSGDPHHQSVLATGINAAINRFARKLVDDIRDDDHLSPNDPARNKPYYKGQQLAEDTELWDVCSEVMPDNRVRTWVNSECTVDGFWATETETYNPLKVIPKTYPTFNPDANWQDNQFITHLIFVEADGISRDFLEKDIRQILGSTFSSGVSVHDYIHAYEPDEPAEFVKWVMANYELSTNWLTYKIKSHH